jgi:hypothetical protein
VFPKPPVPAAPEGPAVPAAARSELLLAGERIDLTVDIGAALAAETGVPLPGDFVPGVAQADRLGGDAGTSRSGTRQHLLLRPPRLTPMIANAS